MEETLEEAAESRYGTDMDSIRGSNVYDLNTDLKKGFIDGAKWQAERMYSKEDMLKCWNAAYIDALAIDEETYKPLFFADFIEQFKK
jgi:hypothetical protein